MAGLLEADYDGYRELYQAFRGADKVIQRSFRKRLVEAGKPLAEAVIAEAPDVLPSRGGLAAWLRTARPTLALTQTRLGIKIGGPSGSRTGKKSDIGAINRGRLRHPVYARPGRRAGWANQRVKPDAYTDAWMDRADDAAEAVASVLDDIIDELT